MPRISIDLITQSEQYTNALRQREIDLTYLAIPAIENLGTTKDQLDIIDLSHNHIRTLENLPRLNMLKGLIIANNRITHVAPNIASFVPNLETLILTDNSIEEIGDLEGLAHMKSLQIISLIQNPVTAKHGYRAYLIGRLPNLRLLDFQKISKKERDEAMTRLNLDEKFKQSKNTFVPGEVASHPETVGPTDAEKLEEVKERIRNANK